MLVIGQVYFPNLSWAVQNNLAEIYNVRNHIYGANFKLKLYMCAHNMALMCAQNHKVSTWNSHKKYDFCNSKILREYFGELVKH